MNQRILNGALALWFSAAVCSSAWAADGTIKIGISASMSGSFASVGESVKSAVEMAKKELESAGGLKVGDKFYAIDPIYVDNGSDRSTASANALNLIGQKQVLAIIGPMSSARAIPMGEVANAFKTPMITPWSTANETTLNRPYVFRMPVMYGIQATAATKFIAKEWKATKVAILYDEVSAYPSGMAKAFRETFEAANGADAVVAFETFRTGDTDFSKQITAILNSGAEVLYTPQHYEEVPLIVRQARKMGWKKPITGSNSWAGGDLMGKCGDDCKGLMFTGNFAPGGVSGVAKTFVEKYQATYKRLPDEPAALAYDAMKLLCQAIQNTGGLTGNLVQDRTNVRTQIAATKNFEGATGTMSYKGSGDPEKCAVIIKIDDNGIYTNIDKVCP